VAKQAAEVDLLTNGRFRLGVGVGWNPVEYEALGRDFTNRGRRSEEQVALLRRLWTERSVTHDGPSERVTGAGIAPRPIQQPIPIWFGAHSAPTFKRAGRLADGWIPEVPPGPQLDEVKAIVDTAAREAGRDPALIGMQGRVSWGPGGVDALVADVQQWRTANGSHVAINTMGMGFASVDDHLDALATAAEGLGVRRMARTEGQRKGVNA
jgi:probable F420-dependent oxidoreductase